MFVMSSEHIHQQTLIAITNCVELKKNERFVVVIANTGTNPWAMMVHFKDAFVTLRAMMGPIRLSSKASSAHSDSSELFTLERHDHGSRLRCLFD